MRRDIFGNVIVTSSDYVSMISDELSFSKKYKLFVNYTTGRGFCLEHNEILPKTGLYAKIGRAHV